MSNLIEIQGQIDKLQKQASEIRAREFDKTVHEILIKMIAFGITLKDLHTAKVRNVKGAFRTVAKAESANNKVKRKGEKVSKVLPVKYCGPNGETWSGRGLTPRWLAALVAQGQTKEEFTIKN